MMNGAKEMSARKTREKTRNAFWREPLSFRVFRVFRGQVLLLTLLFAASCTQKMADQPSLKPLEASPVFPDGRSAREPVKGTVPSGFTRMNGRAAPEQTFDQNATKPPFPVTLEILERGQARFNIYCAVCHGRTGEGDGMVVRRGFSAPPTYHSDRLRQAPIGHFYDVITHGFGGMASYANQVEPRDRWAIAAYIRALQLSQNAEMADLPPELRNELDK